MYSEQLWPTHSNHAALAVYLGGAPLGFVSLEALPWSWRLTLRGPRPEGRPLVYLQTDMCIHASGGTPLGLFPLGGAPSSGLPVP